jgi:hypothetical protein
MSKRRRKTKTRIMFEGMKGGIAASESGRRA